MTLTLDQIAAVQAAPHAFAGQDISATIAHLVGRLAGTAALAGPAAWRASFVRRWHANPDLCHTADPISGHGARCAILALQIWPDASRDLVIACVTHDLGESVTGDIPWGAANKDTAAEQAALEGLGFGQRLGATDKEKLRYVDRLDAFLWMMHHAPSLAGRDDWIRSRKWLDGQAAALGIQP